jgi:hypothetical protein
MRVISQWATAVAVAMAAPADAAWLRVETNHFVVHVDTDEAKARLYATRLESFDAALRRLYGVADDPARRSDRVQVFAFKPSLFVKVCDCSRLAGYYLPAAGESVIVSAYSGDVDKSAPVGAMTSQLVLLHEYSHHFMYSNFPIAYPLWFSEGFAEFNSNVSFGDDRSVTIGLPANYRVDSIHEDHIEMTARQFFNGETNWGNRDVIYGRGWLMTHYLTLSSERQGQLATYLGALNAGKPSWDAAVAGFGDPGKVYSEMLAYRRRPHLAAPLRVPAAGAAPSLTVTRLSEAEAAVLPLRARMAAKLTPAMARSALAQARGLAGAYPRDAGVQLWLARAALAARNLDLAEAAAAAAVEGQPASAEAMTVKGEVAVARAVAGKSTDAATWTAARSWLLRANHADPDAARPLILYYRSFLADHASPSAGAIKGLSRALVLAPEDSGAHLLLARHLLDEPGAALARQLLQPIAFAPHARAGENRARQAIVAIDAGRTADAKIALDAAIGDAPT